MTRQTQHTDAENAATFTGSQPKKSYTTAQFRAVQESLQNGTHNPFERVDGKLLERIHYDLTKRQPSSFEESPF